jgi:hypothetical protein
MRLVGRLPVSFVHFLLAQDDREVPAWDNVGSWRWGAGVQGPGRKVHRKGEPNGLGPGTKPATVE